MMRSIVYCRRLATIIILHLFKKDYNYLISYQEGEHNERMENKTNTSRRGR